MQMRMSPGSRTPGSGAPVSFGGPAANGRRRVEMGPTGRAQPRIDQPSYGGMGDSGPMVLLGGGQQPGGQSYSGQFGQQPGFPSRGRRGGDYSAYGQQGLPRNQGANYPQRDAFIQRINDTMGGYQANQGVYQGDGAPPPSWGRPPQFNFPQLWNQAGQMVASGWTNPLLGLLG